MITINPKYHSLNEGIPLGKHLKHHIGMDTKGQREGLHLWVTDYGTHHEISVHLTRQDAMNLIEEIKERLF